MAESINCALKLLSLRSLSRLYSKNTKLQTSNIGIFTSTIIIDKAHVYCSSLKRFERLFSSKGIDEMSESPRIREFRKKLRERAPIEKLEELEEGKHPYQEKEPLKPFPDNTNPETGEIGGPRGPEPTRYGDWERKGRVTDF